MSWCVREYLIPFNAVLHVGGDYWKLYELRICEGCQLAQQLATVLCFFLLTQMKVSNCFSDVSHQMINCLHVREYMMFRINRNSVIRKTISFLSHASRIYMNFIVSREMPVLR